MKRIENFIYNDIVLYSKGWYKRSENIYDDLGYLFSKIYAWTPKSERDIARLMLRVLDKLHYELDLKRSCDGNGCYVSNFTQFADKIESYMRLYDVNFHHACIYIVLSTLQGLSKSEIKLIAPHYGKKEKFRMGRLFGDYPISQTYKEMNNIAKRIFND